MLWFVRSGATPASRRHGRAARRRARPGRAADAVHPRRRWSRAARIVLGDPVMRSIVILSTAANLAFTGSIVIGLPWLVLVRFGGDALALGLLFAAFGAGSLVGVACGGLTAAPAPVRVDRARLRAHRGRRSRGHRRRAVAAVVGAHPARASVRSTAGSTSSSSPGSRPGRIR